MLFGFFFEAGEEVSMDLYVARAQKRRTQWDLSISTGICQSKLSLMENGYIIPNEHEQAIIAQSLGFDIGDINWGRPREDSDG